MHNPWEDENEDERVCKECGCLESDCEFAGEVCWQCKLEANRNLIKSLQYEVDRLRQKVIVLNAQTSVSWEAENIDSRKDLLRRNGELETALRKASYAFGAIQGLVNEAIPKVNRGLK